MDRELLEFYLRLNGEVKDRTDAGLIEGDVYSENVLTEQVLEHLSSIGMVDNAFVCYHEGAHGRSSVKINGYAVNDDEDHVDLFSTIHGDGEEPRTLPKEEITRAADRALRFFEASCDGFHASLEPAGDAYELAARISRLRKGIDRVRVFIISNDLSPTKKLPNREVRGIDVRFEVWDIERLFRGMLAGVPRDEIDIDFVALSGAPIPCLKVPPSSSDYQAYMAVVPGEVLYKLYDEYGSRLLELNVRSFLGVKGSKTVNSGIRKTLKDEPSRFMAYNNGIVVTADSLETERMPDGSIGIKSAKGLQIVNGGQTTASVHRASKTDKVDISSVYIPAKITVITPEKLDEMVQKISHHANSQNIVQPADFSANHPFHVKIEELSKTVWCPDSLGRWFYERARGSYQVAQAREATTPAQKSRFRDRTPPQRKFTKPELAKYRNSWEQKPHVVSLGAQKNFDHFMQSLESSHRPEWLPDQAFYIELIATAILYRQVQKIVRSEKFPAHQANITTYLIAYLSRRTSQRLDLQGIWRAQQISHPLTDMLRNWSHDVDRLLRSTAQGRMVTEWAKKESCWDALKEQSLVLPESLPPEMASREVTGTFIDGSRSAPTQEKLDPEDYRNIERCRQIDGETWLRIHAWGKKTGALQKWQYGIAHTLAGYAAAGWEKGPSPKQAKQAVIILNAAGEAGQLKAAVLDT